MRDDGNELVVTGVETLTVRSIENLVVLLVSVRFQLLLSGLTEHFCLLSLLLSGLLFILHKGILLRSGGLLTLETFSILNLAHLGVESTAMI